MKGLVGEFLTFCEMEDIAYHISYETPQHTGKLIIGNNSVEFSTFLDTDESVEGGEPYVGIEFYTHGWVVLRAQYIDEIKRMLNLNIMR